MLKSVLLYMSEQPKLQQMAMKVDITRRTAHRFVAGETVQEAVRAAGQLNLKGFSATLDYLGENVSSKDEAIHACEKYLKALIEINRSSVNSNVSLKLTQFGLSISEDLAHENVERLVLQARESNNFVRIDMEGSEHTDATLRIFRALRNKYENVGTVIQAYLFRSEKDIEDLLQMKTRIRLCKGAYSEPPSIAFKKKNETDQNYIKLMRILLKSGIFHGIATHDPKMIHATKEFAERENIAKELFEFQMLYGIRRDLQEELTKQGYRVRIYIPYGEEWYSYLMRRMAERPANLFFVLSNLFRG